MISYIKLKNFKSFSDVQLDLRGAHGIPKKVALIYGENGSGKSNLMLAPLFVSQTFETMRKDDKLPVFDDLNGIGDEAFRNKIISEILKLRFASLEDLIGKYWTIGNENPMEIEIGFFHKNKSGRYQMVFSKNAVIKEELFYLVKQRSGRIFSITPKKVTLSPSVFANLKYKEELQELISKYWGKHTFMSILYAEEKNKNQKFFKESISKELYDVLRMFKRLNVLYKGGNQETGRMAVPFRILQELDAGNVKNSGRKQNKELYVFEDILNQYFTQLYSDIKKAYYKFKKEGNGYRYELYFDKVCGGSIRSIPVSLESTGTRKLLDDFPIFFTSAMGLTAFVDEVDSGIHDLLMNDILRLLKNAVDQTDEGQFIATTHNTLLMDSVPADEVYVLKADAEGEKEIVCISDYRFRTQKANSVRHKYLDGCYQGIPETGYLDFAELIDEAMELKSHTLEDSQ